METLSPHAIACLTLGITPPSIDPPLSGRRGATPAIPFEVEEVVDWSDWKADYERIYLPLRSGIDAGKVVCQQNGEPLVSEAIEYLRSSAEANNWINWLENNEFYKVASQRGFSTIEKLEAQVARHEQEIKKPNGELEKSRKGITYTNKNLRWLNLALAEFFDEYPTLTPVTKGVANWIMNQSIKKNDPVSKTAAERIAMILTPDERKNGGRRSRK